MVNLREPLSAATAKWRRTAQKSRLEAEEISNLLARGHMHGISDGLDLAADDVDAILRKNGPPLEEAK